MIMIMISVFNTTTEVHNDILALTVCMLAHVTCVSCARLSSGSAQLFSALWSLLSVVEVPLQRLAAGVSVTSTLSPSLTPSRGNTKDIFLQQRG